MTMLLQRMMNDNYVIVQIASSLDPGREVPVQLPQETMIRLVDASGIRVSMPFTVPAAPGPATVFFRANGTNDPTSCGTPPVIPRVTINNCNLTINGITEVFSMVLNAWIPFQDPTLLVIPAANGSRTASFPAGTRIRLNYSGDTTDSFLVPSQNTTVSFLRDGGTPSTSEVCKAVPPPPTPPVEVSIIINNCYNRSLNVQQFQNGVWVNVESSTGFQLQVPAFGSNPLNDRDEGTMIRLVNPAGTLPIIETSAVTVTNTSPFKVLFRTDEST